MMNTRDCQANVACWLRVAKWWEGSGTEVTNRPPRPDEYRAERAAHAREQVWLWEQKKKEGQHRALDELASQAQSMGDY